jgi:hypothetical protein
LTRAEIGGTFEGTDIAGVIVTTYQYAAPASQLKVCPTTVIHPDTAAVVAPAITLAAWRTAALSLQHSLALYVALAIVAPTIFRGAGELHCFLMPAVAVIVAIAVTIASSVMITVSVPIAVMVTIAKTVPAVGNLGGVHKKVRAASTINPDALLVESPRCALNAGRLASLPLHGDAGAGIGRAVVPAAIFRGARESILRKARRSCGCNE